MVTLWVQALSPSVPCLYRFLGVLKASFCSRWYVRSNAKPKGRAALALALRVGSLAEEEDERCSQPPSCRQILVPQIVPQWIPVRGA